MYISMQYGHWGITVSKRHDEKDYAPIDTEFFPYPVVNGRGPMDSAATEAAAIAYCIAQGGSPKGPFFKHLG
jgi:hypothetical protein